MLKITPFDPLYSSNAVQRRTSLCLEIARSIALTQQKQRHAAILFQGNRLLGIGVNSYKNAPANVSDSHIHRISIHAEVAACRSHLEVPNTILYVVRAGRKTNDLVLSRPCPECISWLTWNTSVKEVIHS